MKGELQKPCPKIRPCDLAALFRPLGDSAEILFFLDNFFIFALTFLDLSPICSLARIRGLWFPPGCAKRQLNAINSPAANSFRLEANRKIV